MRLRIALRLLVTIPLSGVVIAGILSAGWLVLGSPTVARGATWFSITKVGDSEFIGAPDQPFFTLVLGNDSRSISEDNGLGDAIHVIGVNPATGQASILNVPRDTVALAGADQIALGKDQGLARRAAQETARDNGARFISGRFSETFVTVRVGIQTLGIEAIGQARAEVRTECRLGCPRD